MLFYFPFIFKLQLCTMAVYSFCDNCDYDVNIQTVLQGMFVVYEYWDFSTCMCISPVCLLAGTVHFFFLMRIFFCE